MAKFPIDDLASAPSAPLAPAFEPVEPLLRAAPAGGVVVPPKLNLREPEFVSGVPPKSETATTSPAPSAPSEAMPGSRAWLNRLSDRNDKWLAEKHPVWTAAALLAELGGGYYWYWGGANIAFNSPDWDLQWDKKSWAAKLELKQVRFDTNAFDTNARAHPEAGSAYYLIARENGFKPWQSFIIAFSSSTVWEYCVEWKEKPSINDLTVTPFTGMALGEAGHQFKAFLLKNPLKLSHGVLGFENKDNHAFEFYAGMGAARADKNGVRSSESIEDFGLSASVNNLPDYGKEGRVSQAFSEGGVSELQLRISRDPTGYNGFALRAKSMLAGKLKQDLVADADGHLNGYSFIYGLSTGYDYQGRENHTGDVTIDKIAVVNLLGATVDVKTQHKGLTLGAGVDAFADFALVNSFALQNWLSTNSVTGIKEVLQERGYYYAGAFTVRPRLSAKYGHFDAAAEGSYEQFSSIDGYERDQEKITDDIHLTDKRVDAKLSLGATWRNFKVSGEVENRYREGRIGATESSGSDQRALLNLNVVM